MVSRILALWKAETVPHCERSLLAEVTVVEVIEISGHVSIFCVGVESELGSSQMIAIVVQRSPATTDTCSFELFDQEKLYTRVTFVMPALERIKMLSARSVKFGMTHVKPTRGNERQRSCWMNHLADLDLHVGRPKEAAKLTRFPTYAVGDRR
jgi:hypothetical protein